MTCNPVDVEPVAPDSAQVDDAMNAEPSDDLHPPRGLVLVARHGGAVIGCAGLA